MLTKQDVKRTELQISSYYGSISIRLYDNITNKNVAKIDWNTIKDIVTNKIIKEEFEIEHKKGNALPIIHIN